MNNGLIQTKGNAVNVKMKNKKEMHTIRRRLHNTLIQTYIHTFTVCSS